MSLNPCIDYCFFEVREGARISVSSGSVSGATHRLGYNYFLPGRFIYSGPEVRIFKQMAKCELSLFSFMLALDRASSWYALQCLFLFAFHLFLSMFFTG